MQQLKERRIINTPTDIPHVRSNCGTVLNSLFEVSDSVQYLKTSFNNSDADLTPKEQGEQNLRVFGRRKTGYFDIRTLSGIKLHASVKCSDLQLTESFKTLLWERKSDSSST